ncbi:hypothetical protein DET59_11744 [Rossellomorea aquimaris]|uniref:Uncharacterized protein n=1 Tax=Rossellomorea aquimaris TaxID=189382 RepID=A0A366EL21_9BACI|nr:hypothetical protein DET59_11744 [Rossellomorea aquimaris]
MRMNGEKQKYQVCPLMTEVSMTILPFFDREPFPDTCTENKTVPKYNKKDFHAMCMKSSCLCSINHDCLFTTILNGSKFFYPVLLFIEELDEISNTINGIPA